MPDPAAQLPSPHLDIATALQRIGDAQALRDMLSMMAELLAADVPKITACVQTGDLGQASELLHSLKGCVPIFCALPICTLLIQAERSASSGDQRKVDADHRDLGPALDQLGDEIARYLMRTPAARA